MTQGKDQERRGSTVRRARRNIVDLNALAPGTEVGLPDGATGEVISNPKDGAWIEVRYLTSPDDPSMVGKDAMIFAEEVEDLSEES